MNVIEVKDMELFIELNGLTTSVIGPSNSGKTVLAKRLCNRVDNGNVYIDGKCIKDYSIDDLRRNIAVVLDDNNYSCEFVGEEILYYQDKVGITIEEATKRFNDVVSYFKIKELVDKRIHSIYLSDKILIKILSLLVLNPKIFVVDNLISYLREDKRILLFKYIKKNNISFINITTNPEHLLQSDNVIVLNNFKCVISGSYKSIVEGNSILPYMGLKLPFAVDLSHNLLLYNVVDKIYFDSGKLVDKLWK